MAANADIAIIAARSAAENREFLLYPEKHHAGDPNWRPPFYMFEKARLDRRKNPFFGHAEIEYMLAKQGDETRGRIAAFIDRRHNERHGEKTVFFGLFEAQTAKVAAALLKAAENWGLERGMTQARGPVSLTMEEGVGFQISGFDNPPYMMMHYNGPEYPDWMEKAGYSKAKDLYAWLYHPRDLREEVVQGDEGLMAFARHRKRMKRVNDRTLRNLQGRIHMRTSNWRTFASDTRLLYRIYNEAWYDNWGFTPLSDEEVAFVTDGLRLIYDPLYFIIVEMDGEPAAVSLLLPDLNQLSAACNGRLFPFGWMHYFRRRKIMTHMRLAILGVLPEWRLKGLEMLMIQTFWDILHEELKYSQLEVSWVLEDNHSINNALKAYYCDQYKTYRVYQKALKASA